MVESVSKATRTEVDIVEVLHVVADFLQEQNLHKSAATLIQEAKLANLQEQATEGETLQAAIMAG